MRTPHARLILPLTLLAVIATAGCSSSSPSSSTNDNGKAAPAAKASGATISGDYTGTMTVTLCTASNIGSVAVHLNGDSTAYLGSVSARSLGFLGPKGEPFSLTPSSRKPVVSSSGTTFTLDHLSLSDVTLSHKSVTVTGTLHCP